MNASDNFNVADKAQMASTVVFWLVTAMSATLLIFPAAGLDAFLEPLLIVSSLAGLVSGFVVMVYQNRGNHFQRASQLSNALGAPIGDELRATYYNNDCSPSLVRLAATTMENSLFTTEVLMRMLRKERVAVSIYLVFLVLFLAYRNTTLHWLVLIAQTVFSADVVLNWLRMERFRFRVWQVHNQLRQLFLQGANGKKPVGAALIIAAFSDYECAKDEAAMPLDSAIFTKLNPTVSARWEELKKSLNIT